MIPKTIPAVLLLLAAGRVAAADIHHTPHQALTVVYQGPRVIAAQPFFNKLQGMGNAPAISQDLLQKDKAARDAIKTPITLAMHFPIESAELSPGEPTIQTVQQLYQPFFVMGMDGHSIGWLRNHYRPLAKQNAFGLVVQADHWDSWLQLKAEAAGEGITLSLLPGDGLAGIYGIHSYPTLFLRDN